MVWGEFEKNGSSGNTAHGQEKLKELAEKLLSLADSKISKLDI